ncbi:MAG: PilN domain-containing protein [Longimicrobiales bacterium]
MIEVNLLPGSGKRARKRGMPKLGAPAPSGPSKGPSLPKFNRGLVFSAVSWGGGIVLLAWMVMGGMTRKDELKTEIEAAVLDSARLAEIIKTTEALNERMRAVSGKLSVVQEVDASRFVWPHILDELARALPEHTWFVRLSNLPADSGVKYPKFTVEGRTGNNFALTKYLQQLEASPFIRQVRLKQSQLIRENEKLVYAFMLDADYEMPSPDLIQTEPLFASNLDAADTGGAPNTGGAGGARNAAPNAGRTAPNAGRGATPNAAPNARSAAGRNTTAAKPRTQEPR